MPTVLCQRYWNESFLIIVQRASLTAQMLESAREQTDRQPHPLFCKPIMTHNLHVTRSDPLLLNSSTPFCSDLNNSTGKKKKRSMQSTTLFTLPYVPCRTGEQQQKVPQLGIKCQSRWGDLCSYSLSFKRKNPSTSHGLISSYAHSRERCARFAAR